MLTKRDVIPALDGLRGLAILLVLAGHLPHFHGELARFGVDLFFLLSGFLITRILLYNKEHGVPLRHFLARRAVRIFPIYYLTLLVVGMWLGFGDWLLYTATYTFNLVSPDKVPPPLWHTWSLCVEEHFYLIWPLLVMYLTTQTSHRVAVRAVLVITAVAVVYREFGAALHLDEPMAYHMRNSTFFRAMSLLVGSLLAFHETQWRGSRRWGLAAIVFLVLGLAVFNMPGDAIDFHIEAFNTLMGSLLAALGVFIVSVNLLPRLFSLSPLRWTGKISYGLYLYHWPIYMGLVFGIDRPRYTLPLTFAIAAVSFYLLEAPLLQWVRRRTIAYKPVAGATAIAPQMRDATT